MEPLRKSLRNPNPTLRYLAARDQAELFRNHGAGVGLPGDLARSERRINEKKRILQQTNKNTRLRTTNLLDDYLKKCEKLNWDTVNLLQKSDDISFFHVSEHVLNDTQFVDKVRAQFNVRQRSCLVCDESFPEDEGILLRYDRNQPFWIYLRQLCSDLHRDTLQEPQYLTAEKETMIRSHYNVSEYARNMDLDGALLSKRGVLPPTFLADVEDLDFNMIDSTRVDRSSNVDFRDILHIEEDITMIEQSLFGVDFQDVLPTGENEEAHETPLRFEAEYSVCNSCYSALASTHPRVPDLAIANGLYIGSLDGKRYNKSDIAQCAVASGLVLLTIKTYSLSQIGHKVQSNGAIFDLGESVAEAAEREGLLNQYGELRIIIQRSLSNEIKNEIRYNGSISKPDLKDLNDILTIQNHHYKSQDIVAERLLANQNEDRVYFSEEMDIPAAEEHSGVTGPINDGATSYRLYSSAPTRDGDEVYQAACQLAGKAAQISFQDNTATVFPGSSRVSIATPGVLESTFPILFPFGFAKPRHLNLLQFVRHTLKLSTGDFARSPQYLAIAFISDRNTKVTSRLSLTMQNTRNRALSTLHDVWIGPKNSNFTDPITAMGNKKNLEIDKTNMGKMILKPAFDAANSAPGSSGERKHIAEQGFALMTAFGAPTWFLSMSPKIEDHLSIILFLSTNTDDDGSGMSTEYPLDCSAYTEKAVRYLAEKNPVACVIILRKIFLAFIGGYLGWDFETASSKPNGGRLGIVEYFFGAFETNSRHILHLHLILRIKGAPRGRQHFHQLRKKSKDFDSIILDYLLKTLATMDPTVDDETAICPACKETGLEYIGPVPLAYATKASRSLPDPCSWRCSRCQTSWNSGDVIRNTAMHILLDFADKRQVWEKQEVYNLVRNQLLGGSTGLFENVDDLANGVEKRAWTTLLINYFQEHLRVHTSTCFSKGSGNVCRMQYPRKPIETSKINADGEVIIQRNNLSEWTNFSLALGMEIFRCNQDASFLLSGSIEGTSVVYYVTKYVGKPQQPLDEKHFQLVLMHCGKALDDQIATLGLRGPQEQYTIFKNLLYRTAFNLCRFDEFDPQLMALLLLHGPPSIVSHECVTMHAWQFVDAFEGRPLQSTFMDGHVKKDEQSLFVRRYSQLEYYLHRPIADENLCLYLFCLLREVEYTPPEHDGHRFLPELGDAAKARRIKPRRHFPIFKPEFPAIAYLGTKLEYFQHHEHCKPEKCNKNTRDALAYLIDFPEGNSYDEFVIPPPPEMVPDADYNFEDIDNCEIQSCMSEVSDEADGCMDDPVEKTLRKWAIMVICIFGTYRNLHERKCKYESLWDRANRVLFNLLQDSSVSSLQGQLAKIALRAFFNINEMQRSPDDRMQERHKREAFQNNAIESLRTDFPNHPKNDIPSTDFNEESSQDLTNHVLESILKQVKELRDPEMTDTKRMIGSLGAEFRKFPQGAAKVDVPVILTDTFYAKDPANNPLLQPSNGASPNVTSNPAQQLNPFITFTPEQNILLRIANSLDLGDDQRFAFFIVGSKLVSRLRPEIFHQTSPMLRFSSDFTSKNLRLIISGQAGTGKSLVVKAIKTLADSLDRPSAIKVVAYTGVAATQVGGTTIHSLLGLSLRTSKGDACSKNEVIEKMKDCVLLIVDEYSLCGKSTFARMNLKLRACLDDKQSFGGLDVLLIGDPLQFDPISDPALHSPKSTTALHAASDASLKDEFNTVVVLRKVFRTKGDDDFRSCLSDLRNPHHFDDDDKLKATLEKINKRHLAGQLPMTTTNPPLFIVPTNSERHVITIAAKDFFRNEPVQIYEWKHKTGKSDSVLDEAQLQIVEEYFWQTGSSLKAPPSFWAFVGMPVAITQNISINHQKCGLANGAHGIIVGFRFGQHVPNGQGIHVCSEMPECILVKLDSPTPYTVLGLEKNVLPIYPIQVKGYTSFKNLKRLKPHLSVKFDYFAFPLKHRFASTYQSMQCLTAKNIILQLPPSMGGERSKMLYMGLSRATTWNDVRFVDPIDLNHLKRFKPTQQVCDIFAYLEKLDASTRDSLRLVGQDQT